MTSVPPPMPSGLSALKAFARPPVRTERCELCSRGLGVGHDHLFEPKSRELKCACAPCSLLFDQPRPDGWKRVPRVAETLTGFCLDDGLWESLSLPIGLAWFTRSSSTGKVVAYYPGPAGAAESQLPLAAWAQLVEKNPVLATLADDVEALLVNRVGNKRLHLRVSIDVCYELTGILRTRWRGFTGGAEIWAELEVLFARLGGGRDA